jgi:hypothetical protein
MSRTWRRLGLSLTVAVATVSAGVIGAGAARASTPPVASGRITFGGNDAISTSDFLQPYSSHSYSTSNSDYITVAAGSSTGLTIGFGTSVQNQTGSLTFQAPAGQQLAVGTYTGALRANTPIGSAPGLDLTFSGLGCNTVSGSFTIYQFTLGADGSVDTLNATFDQVCDNGPGKAQGRVLINVAGPPLQRLTASSAATGLVTTGRLGGPIGGQQATVSGTLTCTQSGQVTITGTLYEPNFVVVPQLSGTVTCTPGSAVPWTASGGAPFPPSLGTGNLILTAAYGAFDPYYLITPTAGVNAAVQLIQPAPPPSCVISRCGRVSFR